MSSRTRPQSVALAARRALASAARRPAVSVEPLEGRQMFSVINVADQAAFNAAAGSVSGTITVRGGDTLLLAAGETFTGTVRVAAGGPTPGAQVYVGTYNPANGVADTYTDTASGSARAYVRADDAAPAMPAARLHVPAGSSANAIHVQDVGNVVIRNLVLDGSTAGLAPTAHNSVAANGVFLSYLAPTAGRLDYVRIDNVVASGFANRGVLIDDSPDNGTEDKVKTGFNNVRLTDVTAADNVIAGIEVLGDFSGTATTYAHSDLYVGYSTASGNTGRASYTAKHTGSGIVISDVTGATIEHCVATDNGENNDATGGPVGIWAWDVDAVAIRYNESYANKTDAGADGGGFDLDGGVTNSVVEYNYSHDNAGAGYGIYQFGGARAFYNNVFRYNVSANDGRKGSYGAFDFWNGNGSNGIRDTHVYNNTVYVTPSTVTTTTVDRKGKPVTTTTLLGDPRALRFISGTVDVTIRNNVFQTTGGQLLAQIDAKQTNLQIQGNDWWSSGAAFSLKSFAKTYTSFSAFVSGTGYETVGTTTVGKNADPRPGATVPAVMPTVGVAGALPGSTALDVFKLTSTSTIKNTGLNLWTYYGSSAATRDFYGNALPTDATAAASFLYSIGAHELA